MLESGYVPYCIGIGIGNEGGTVRSVSPLDVRITRNRTQPRGVFNVTVS